MGFSLIKIFIPLFIFIKIIIPARSFSAEKEIKVVASIYPPFVFYENGRLAGFDIDLLEMICRTNGLICPVEIVPFQEVLNALKEGRADIGIGAIYVTDERERFIKFTSPYLETGLVYVYRADSEPEADLSGKRIGVKKLATGEIKARELAKKFKNLQIITFASTEESINALIEGTVDLVINDYINSMVLMHEKYLGKIKIKKGILGFPDLLTRDSIAIAVNRERGDLRDIFESTLKEFREGGIMKRMLEKWTPVRSVQDYRKFIVYGLMGLIGLGFLFAGITGYLRHRERYRLIRENEERFRSLIENAPNPVIITTETGRITFLNRNFRDITGYDIEKIKTLSELNQYLECNPPFREFNSPQEAINEYLDYRIRCADGKSRVWNFQLSSISMGNRERTFIIIANDITDKKEMEEKLRLAQKMEIIGRFTGSIAHDFNNYLTAIIGFSEIVSMKLNDYPELKRHIDAVLESAEKAASLIKQLLAFSRKQVMKPQVMNLNEIVLGISKLIKKIIGEDIELKLDLYPSLWNIKADPAQIEQVVMNLVSNASDAMPDGGVLTIHTSNTFFDDDCAMTEPSVTPGEYVMLAVEDTGIGMTEEVKARIFEPFFTTKEKGKGTGLGLATVYGIVKQSGGHISVHSEQGRGSTFKIYFPKTDEQPAQISSTLFPESIPSGDESILIVEDNKAVREFMKSVLIELGYRVYEAEDGIKALEILKEKEGKVDLLITDLIMPKMRGDRLAKEVEALYPGLKILLISGYTEDIKIEKGSFKQEIKFLDKPLNARQLAVVVREVLDS
ncbi:MAG: transporter substrate-binding domain-containing protein [Thermodesulfovibrionales bacterium]|nr:transporter substrate-binding domain-containing protein [Thermodesulfovibrionales bacterium]